MIHLIFQKPNKKGYGYNINSGRKTKSHNNTLLGDKEKPRKRIHPLSLSYLQMRVNMRGYAIHQPKVSHACPDDRWNLATRQMLACQPRRQSHPACRIPAGGCKPVIHNHFSIRGAWRETKREDIWGNKKKERKRKQFCKILPRFCGPAWLQATVINTRVPA